MDRAREFEVKRGLLGKFLGESGLDGLVLGRADNFAWLGCGADSTVNSASETGVGALVATADSVALVANNIETERLLTEELDGLKMDAVETFDWHNPPARESLLAGLIGSGRFAADDGSCGLPPLPEGFQELRYTLTEAEIKRYRALGADASKSMEAVAASIHRGIRERQVAALLAGAMVSRGATPVVLLVAADERIGSWRHPLPKGTKAEQYCMMVACARRKGLVAAITRFVHFGEMPEDLSRRHRAVCRVDAAMMASTRPGVRACEVLEAARKAYEQVGYADEWRFHHQGGAIGYMAREYVANPQSSQVISARQAFAWNPSIRGTKSEDTMLVTEDGHEVLTGMSPRWPSVEVEVNGQVVRRPGMLVK